MRNKRSFLILISLMLLCAGYAFAQNQVDLSFSPVPSLAATSAVPKGQVVQADGKVIVWGGSLAEIASMKGMLVRLNMDGSADPTFNFCGCSLTSVTNVLLQA